MWWRLPRGRYNRPRGNGNRRALRALIEAGHVPGILGYVDGQPVAWCAIGPREHYPAMSRSPLLRRVDDQPVWCVNCFFVARPFRRQGLMVPLLQAAIAYARALGASIIEGYPVEPKRTLEEDDGSLGVASAFRKVGFVEVLRRSETHPIMRYFVSDHVEEG